MTVVPAFHVARASLVIALVLDTMASQGAEFGGGEKNFGGKEAAELVAKARTKRDCQGALKTGHPGALQNRPL
jgi:hypothetical protein